MQNINGSIFLFWSPLEMRTQAETACYTTMQNIWEPPFRGGSRQKNIGKQSFPSFSVLWVTSCTHSAWGSLWGPWGAQGSRTSNNFIEGACWKKSASLELPGQLSKGSWWLVSTRCSDSYLLSFFSTTGYFLHYAIPNFCTKIFFSSCISEWHVFFTSSMKESYFNFFTSKNAHIFGYKHVWHQILRINSI